MRACSAAATCIVLAARGGGYGPGTPARGLGPRRAVAAARPLLTGLEPGFITAELTLADSTGDGGPARLAAESLASAEREIDALWAPSPDSDCGRGRAR